MKAVLFYGPQNIKIEEKEILKLGPGEVVVKNKVALTCGTDVKMYLRGHPLWRPPFALGHEAAGVIVEVGKGVKDFKIGDRVVAHNSAPCNKCYYCKRGQHSMCENILFNFGAFAEYQKIPKEIVEQNMFKIPDSISYEDAALLEPLSCVVYGIDEIGISLGDTVVINGAGPIGLMFVRLAYFRGAKVIVTDISEERLNLAHELGAAFTINVAKVEDQVKAVKELREDKRGVDVAIEAVGLPEVWEKLFVWLGKVEEFCYLGGQKVEVL